MWRYLNMFICIGVALVGISIAGFATGSKFLTEAGQTPNPSASVIYLGVGALMLINGVVSVRLAMQPRPKPEPKPEAEEIKE
jgi:hypothetical protein